MPEIIKILIILSTCVTNFLIGFIAFRKNSRNIVNRFIAIFAWVFSLWSLALFFYDYPVIFNSLFWIKVTYLIVVFGIVNCIFHFSFIFPTGKALPPLWGRISFFVSAFIFGGVILFTDLFVSDVVRRSWGYDTILGPAYIPFNIWATVYAGWGLVVLVKKYRQAQGYIKGQLKYMFLGLALFVISVLILDSIIPTATGESKYFSISTASSLFFVAFTSYAIIKHRLLDIRVALQEIVVFAMTTSFISLLLILGALGFWILSGEHFKVGVIFLIVGLSCMLTLFYEKISLVSKKIAGDYLSLSVYDYQKVLKNLSSGLSAYLDLQKLIDILTETLVNIFKLKKIALVVYEKESSKYIIKMMSNFSGSNGQVSNLWSSLVVNYIDRSSKILVLDEIKQLIGEVQNEAAKIELEEIAQIMEQNEVSLIVPLIGNQKIISLIVCGEKASSDPYTVQDINFLNTVAYEASIAFQNAKSYEESQKFNIILRDEVNKAIRELQNANRRLTALDRLKDDFVSLASHELRTPMTAIRSYAWMALHRSDTPLSEKMEKYLVRILISTERLINLVNDLLNISRIESGKIEINPEAIDMISLCKDIADEVYYSKSADKDIKINLLEQKVPKVFADPEKLREVLLNVMGNAVKFSPNGGKITVGFFTDGITLEVFIKDEGPGISHEDIGKLFEKFSRLDSTFRATATTGGTGLGLYISKKLTELMHGRIWATSEGVGKGATFTISLPIVSKQVLEHAEEFKVKALGDIKHLEPVAI